MKQVKRVLSIIFVVLFLLMLGYIGWTFYENRIAAPMVQEPMIDAQMLSNSVKEISELATKEYFYSNVGFFEDSKDFYGWKLPLTNKKFIIRYQGKVKLGINAGMLQIVVQEKDITVYMPDVIILSHEIEESSIQVMEEKSGMFNAIKIDDFSGFVAEQKRMVEEELKLQDIYKETQITTQEQLEQFLRTVLSTAGVEDYTITFKSISEYPNSVNFTSSTTRAEVAE